MAFPISPSNNATTVVNGILYVYNSTNNAWKVVANTIIAGIDGFARSTANAAYVQANTPSYTANSASAYANASFTAANSAGVYANSAYVQANTPSSTANSASFYANASFTAANSAGVYANSAYTAANSAGVYANAAFLQANTPSYTANSGSSYANSAFIQSNGAFGKANSANILAQNAYDTANTKVSKSGDTMTGDLLMTANILPTVTNTYQLGSIDKVWRDLYVGPGSINVDGIKLSNTGSGSLSITSASGATLDIGLISGTANSAALYANGAFLKANTPSYTANSASVYANGAFTTANSAGVYANSAYVQANTPSYTANSSASYANAAFTAANTADVKAVTAGSYANSAFTAANTADTKASSAGSYANSAFIAANTPSYTANSAASYANSGFIAANTADAKAVTAGSYANSAYTQANSATATALSAASYANSAFSAANAASAAANTATDSYARSVANAAFIQANTALLYNTAISNTVTSVQVGGAAPALASTWKTYTMVQALDAILFPTLGPSYTLPTISFSASVSGIREIGTTISQALNLTGIKNDAGPFTQLRFLRNASVISTNNSPTRSTTSNVASQFGYEDPNNQNYAYANTYTDSFVVVSGSTTYSGDGNYSAGLAKLNNKGTTDSNSFAVLSTTNPQSAQNNYSGGSDSVTGIYPYFWSVSSSQPTGSSIASAIAAGTTNKVLEDASGSISITWNASAQYVWFAVPASYTTKTSWYNTALNNGSIGSGQFILGPVTQNVTSPSSYWTGVSYKIYISGYATTTSGSITLS